MPSWHCQSRIFCFFGLKYKFLKNQIEINTNLSMQITHKCKIDAVHMVTSKPKNISHMNVPELKLCVY